MPRSARVAPGGVSFQCLNRGNDRRELFADDADYAAFERVPESALEAVPLRLLAYYRLVLGDSVLKFILRLTVFVVLWLTLWARELRKRVD